MATETKTTREVRSNEAHRLVDLDAGKLDHQICYGFRMRCRGCMTEVQANLPHHATEFMEAHDGCGRKPRLS